jgi:AmmeMemoRadiSam system protein B
MLPRLRTTLDFMPSPLPDQPGLLIRDPLQFSDAALVIPPPLVECLRYFDGEQSELDLRAHLVRLTGDLNVGPLQQHLVETLSRAGFLEDESFEQIRRAAERAFAESPARLPSHAGSAYPEEAGELASVFSGYLNGAAPRPAAAAPAIAIAAPHASPFGAVDSYRAAYSALSPGDAARTFVILGTSHYGAPDRFGLTRKPFVTPYGTAQTDVGLVDELERAGGEAVAMEDYCHAVEHSIEFQVVFLQHLFGPEIRILPVLCGSFYPSLEDGGLPERNQGVRRMFDALGEIAAREGSRLLWVLGVDMAHVGQRYGDRFAAVAGRGEMERVAERDRARIQRIGQGDPEGFWEQVRENRDDLKWCGSAPIYTFLRALPAARGELLHYQQWNIDPASVVSFAGMRFQR